MRHRAIGWMAGASLALVASAAHAQTTTTYIPDPAEAALVNGQSSFDGFYGSAVFAGFLTRDGSNAYHSTAPVTNTSGVSFYNTITSVAIVQSRTANSTEVIGNLIGRGKVFDQTYDFASGTSAFDSAVALAGRAVVAAGSPAFVRLLTPRLVSSGATTSTAIVIQDKVTASPIVGGNWNLVTTVTLRFGPTTFLTGALGLCATTGSDTALPSGCSATKATTINVSPGDLVINSNLAEEQKITQTTTTTTTTTNTQVWEIDGTAAQLGTVHAVVPVAGFDQSEGYAGRLLEQIDAASGHVAPWVQGWGQRNRTDGGDPLTGAAPGDSRSAYGFDVGASAALVPMLRIGASIDYGRTDIAVPAVGERARVAITEVAAFGRVGALRGPFMAFGGGYGWGDDTTYVTPGGASQTATASERLHLGWATGALGWRIGGRAMAITPSIGATFTRVTLDGFSEQGSTFGLRGSRASVARTLAWAGLDAAGAVGPRLTAHVWARGAHYGGDLAPVLGVAFASDPTNATPLAIAAPRDARWGADLGAGIACRIAPHLEAFLATAADLRGSGRTLEASGGLRMTL